MDLIADVFFSILEEHPKAQLICIGPVIDLYGKFAALKLAKMMIKFPSRVYSKPEFTALPPCIFSGAEFALIPSRDEPFGLVAVEFGRKVGVVIISPFFANVGRAPLVLAQEWEAWVRCQDGGSQSNLQPRNI